MTTPAWGKPPCDWDDPKARESLVDALARDAQAALEVLDGRELDGPLAEAAQLLGLVAGQDVEAGEDGVFRIARRVARDRLISTVDVEARHGHKSRARTFDGYKSHLSVDPDEELITNVAITAANTADREVIDELLNEPVAGAPADAESDDDDDDGSDSQNGSGSKGFEVYGDSAYAGGATLDEQTQRGHDMRAKVPPVRNANGYSKDQFRIDLAGRTVTCPADHTVSIRAGVRHPVARFGVLCQSCPLRAECTKSRRGRVISIHPREAALQHAKAAPTRSGLAAGLPDLSAGGGTQDQPLHPPPLGWPKSPLPRTQTHPDRHPGPSRRHQPRPTGRPGPTPRSRGLGDCLTPPPTDHPRGQFSDAVTGQNSDAVDANPPGAITSAAS